MKFKKMPFEAFDASCTSLLSWSNIRVPDSSAKLSIGHVLGSHYEMDATYRIFDENHQEMAFLHQYGRASVDVGNKTLKGETFVTGIHSGLINTEYSPGYIIYFTQVEYGVIEEIYSQVLYGSNGRRYYVSARRIYRYNSGLKLPGEIALIYKILDLEKGRENGWELRRYKAEGRYILL
jgi:hypothetical protein